MTSHETKHVKLPPGKWFWNIAPLGSEPDWVIGDAPTPDREPLIFGHTWQQIEEKQMRRN